jgi:hypothetical protein
MSRKESSHLEAVADRYPFGKAWRLDHPAENGERSVVAAFPASVPAFHGHVAGGAKINAKISSCSDWGIPPFAQTAKDGPPAAKDGPPATAESDYYLCQVKNHR